METSRHMREILISRALIAFLLFPVMARVLVVDDVAEIRDLMLEILSLSGHEIATASNGEEALWKFREMHPDLVLLDISMPGMNGYDVLRALRECPEGQNAKVVMMTALSDPKAVQKALELGARDYFVKGSIEIDHLLNRVDQHVQASN